jgi:glycosyltransferase involved in cell wall biosynthesis
MPEADCSATSLAPVPVLSVVVASVNGRAVLEPTLDALDTLPERDRIEVIVVETVGLATREHVRARRPEVVLVEAERQSIPRLRYAGIVRARGELVAILEDHARVDRGWAAALLKEHERPWGAVGGPVENGNDGLVNWAAFFCEYAPYMSPVVDGETADLPGNNIAYKRPHLMRHAQVLEGGKWESWINDRLRADGVAIASTQSMVVHHIKPFRLGNFLTQRFHFARSYAGMRRHDQSWAKRLLYGIGSLALPALLTARVTRTVLAKGRHVGRFLLVSPLVVAFLTVGAFGEMVGYLLGSGASLEQVE